MRPVRFATAVCVCVAFGASALAPASAIAQSSGPSCSPAGVCVVHNDAELRNAIAAGGSLPGSTIAFGNTITLSADLPSVTHNVMIDGNGFALNGANQYRGLIVGAIGSGSDSTLDVTIRNLTIQNTTAVGGAGGS